SRSKRDLGADVFSSYLIALGPGVVAFDQTDGVDCAVAGLPGDRTVAGGKVVRQDAWSQSDMRDRAAGQQAEVGWVLDPAAQGRGLGTELAAALLDLAFDGLGVRRVEAACFAANLASRRVMEKIGLRLEGVFRGESLHRSGRWLDGASYALLASEHRARILEP